MDAAEEKLKHAYNLIELSEANFLERNDQCWFMLR